MHSGRTLQAALDREARKVREVKRHRARVNLVRKG